MVALPRIYTLEEVSIDGLVESDDPGLLCPKCRRQTRHYETIDFALEAWPVCDLISDRDSYQLFISERLLSRFEAQGIRGYRCQPVAMRASANLYPEYDEKSGPLPAFYYLIITRRYDGPWQYSEKGEPCPLCGFPLAIPLPGSKPPSLDEISAVRLGDVSGLKPTRVFADGWGGEDIFFHTEGDTIVITERLAEILTETGNLRKDEIPEADRQEMRRLIPTRAAELERYNWLRPPCSVLGPAEWVE